MQPSAGPVGLARFPSMSGLFWRQSRPPPSSLRAEAVVVVLGWLVVAAENGRGTGEARRDGIQQAQATIITMQVIVAFPETACALIVFLARLSKKGINQPDSSGLDRAPPQRCARLAIPPRGVVLYLSRTANVAKP
ncbi:uncharacterized protein B0I36DRAFT_350403 [Microdochium trichocladiopsis]|uniref:Uncharacterized protein n=1 Tax=Microdochium trichocladiopsis TaxID=1682393 RepID=A0A9P8Y5R9_9PEZI|nr:uncharacterized protein B0I36DRAFT_350403 [Microdochium trichocladiopsis]KAH7029550.1 hypothetical protein B0I36DRAFT_350403 [Microdochium trichocladiopsis]